MDRDSLSRRCRRPGRIALAAVGAAMPAVAARASAAPEGSEFVMADWMLFSFLSFFGAALVVFLIAARRGMLRDMEGAKYHLLSVEEPDYYTPDWAKEADDAPQRQ